MEGKIVILKTVREKEPPNRKDQKMYWNDKGLEILWKTLESHKSELKSFHFNDSGSAVTIVSTHDFPDLPCQRMDVCAIVDVADIADALRDAQELNNPKNMNDVEYMAVCWGYIESDLWTYHDKLADAWRKTMAKLARQLGEIE